MVKEAAATAERAAKRARHGVLLTGETTLGAQVPGLRQELLNGVRFSGAKGYIRRASPTKLEFKLYFDDERNATRFRAEFAKLVNVASLEDLHTTPSDGAGVEALAEYRMHEDSPHPVGSSVKSGENAQRAHIIAAHVLSSLGVRDRKWDWNMIPMEEAAHRAFDQGKGHLELTASEGGRAGQHVVKFVRFDGNTGGSQSAELELGEQDLQCRREAIEWSTESLKAWHDSADVRTRHNNVQEYQAKVWADRLPKLVRSVLGAPARLGERSETS